MEKLDRLGWAAEMHFSTHGLSFAIRSNEITALEELAGYLPPACLNAEFPVVDRLYSVRVGTPSPRPGVRPYHVAYAGWTRIARVLDQDETYRAIEQDLQLFVAEHCPARIFVHAGVVAWRGRAIVIPGRTLAGKSTLVAALVRAGATYYSDEFAVLDARGRVHPFARRLSLRQDGDKPPLRCSAEELGGNVGRKPLPVGVVLVSEYRAGARWRPRRLTPGQAVLALLANTIPARSRPKEALEALGNVVRSAALLKSKRGEAQTIVGDLLHKAW